MKSNRSDEKSKKVKNDILDYLKDYIEKESIRFHMPGHKGKNLDELRDIVPSGDITEIYGSDNLHFPKGIIKESQNKASNIYGSIETLFGVNGSTSSIYSAITGSLMPREKILLQRDSHKAAYNAVILGDIEVEYVNPIYDSDLEINLGINPCSVEEKFKNDSEIKAIFLTYPSYYGICSDLRKIIEIANKYDILVIVDEAHGSHFRFSDSLPKSAIDLGADIVIQSTHKTLTGFTQTSMLHICSDRVNSSRIKAMSRIYQSTSPSYLLLSSLDYTVGLMKRDGKKLLKKHLDNLDREIYFKYKKIMSNDKVTILDESTINKKKFNFDRTKVVFSILGYTGKELESILRNKYNIELEMSDHKYCVALTTFRDTKSELISLYDAILDISDNIHLDMYEDISESEDISTIDVNAEEDIYKKKYDIYHDISNNIYYNTDKNPEKVMSLREAFYSEKESIPIYESAGRICADMIIPYPPGVPVLVQGELIDAGILEYIGYLLKRGIFVQGIENGFIEVIK